jgi:hypothetical protein
VVFRPFLGNHPLGGIPQALNVALSASPNGFENEISAWHGLTHRNFRKGLLNPYHIIVSRFLLRSGSIFNLRASGLMFL